MLESSENKRRGKHKPRCGAQLSASQKGDRSFSRQQVPPAPRQ